MMFLIFICHLYNLVYKQLDYIVILCYNMSHLREESFMKIAVAGTGYVGLSLATLLS